MYATQDDPPPQLSRTWALSENTNNHCHSLVRVKYLQPLHMADHHYNNSPPQRLQPEDQDSVTLSNHM